MVKGRVRKGLYVDEGHVRTWGGDPAWAVCPKPESVHEIAQELAERDGREPDDVAVVEAYVDAIRDAVFDAVDELLSDIRRTSRDGIPTDQAARVRLIAARRLAERHAAEPVGVTS